MGLARAAVFGSVHSSLAAHIPGSYVPRVGLILVLVIGVSQYPNFLE